VAGAADNEGCSVSANQYKNPVSNRSRQFHAALASACLPRIDKVTVPILSIRDDRLSHDRTGVLYRIGDYFFALTASHHLRGTVDKNIPCLYGGSRS
jgi:hypothetical protein